MLQKPISNNAYKTLFLHLLFIVSTLLTNSFIHVLLWRLRSDFGYIAYFDLMYGLLMLVGYFFSGFLLAVLKSKQVFRLSFFILIIMYSLILHLREGLIDHLLLLGTLQGLGSGIYWGTYNLLQIRLTNDQNREHFFGTLAGLFTVLATFLPALTGFLITYLPQVVGMEFAGYYLLYALSISVLLIMAGYVELLPVYSLRYFRFSQVLGITNSQRFKNFSFYELLNGFSETATKLLLVIFSYQILKTEFSLGLYSAIFGLFGAAYIYFLSKRIDIKKRSLFILIGAFLIFFGKAIFITHLNLNSLIADRILSTLGGPLFGFPAAAIILSTIESRSNFFLETESQYLAAREIALGFGRFFGALFFIMFVTFIGSQNLQAIKVWFFVVSMVPILQWKFIRKI